MKTIYIILLFGAAFLALFEQSQAKPNMIIMIVAMAAFMIGLMRLMAKVPGKDEHQNEGEESDGTI
ncbi:hypothetical protein AAEO56_00120 [Flavobacterium sp. DGU11]|uniref:DUF2933 domain-containing protein n=1 Tax=Flavobacterium arundinis TaxID=3139143 RepID=A0ABU9HSW0_9FLAO